MGEAEPGLAEDGEGRDIVEMMLVVAPPQHSTGTPRRSPAGRKRRSDAGRSVKGLGEIASIAKLRNMFMGNVTAMQSYGSMMNYDKDGEHIKLTPQQIKKVRAAFDLYDEDKSGAISADEMAKARAASRDYARRPGTPIPRRPSSTWATSSRPSRSRTSSSASTATATARSSSTSSRRS